MILILCSSPPKGPQKSFGWSLIWNTGLNRREEPPRRHFPPENAGESEAVAMDLTGHDSKAISANYTRIDEAAKRAALNLLPDVLIWTCCRRKETASENPAFLVG